MSTHAMTWEDTPAVSQLRDRLRTIIRNELPEGFLDNFVVSAEWQDQANAFCRRLARDRLLTFAWPVEHGGAGASVWEQTALREEFWAHHEPRGAQYMGVNWVGPAIMHYGTTAQQEQHLPAIAAGEEVWCQGFSEPEAGSDLASLKLSAVAQGDGTFLANGQKIWTSYATFADWCFLTTRTSSGSRKQQGITVFLVPMNRPGITVREIGSIMGPNHLNEVFFDDVVLHKHEILGEIDRGWDVIELVLKYERVGIARYARSDRLLAEIAPIVAAATGAGSEKLRGAHAQALVRSRIARLMSYRVISSMESGGAPANPSAARIAATTLDKEAAEVAMDALGSDAVDASERAALEGRVEDIWRYARSSTIASGTTEIQRLLTARALTRG